MNARFWSLMESLGTYLLESVLHKGVNNKERYPFLQMICILRRAGSRKTCSGGRIRAHVSGRTMLALLMLRFYYIFLHN